MRIAFVNQPGGVALPPYSSAVNIWTYQVARRLAAKCQVVIYAGSPQPCKSVVKQDGIEFRLIPVEMNWPLCDAMRRLGRRIGLASPGLASPFYHLGYALGVARDMRSLRPDIVHVQSFSNFVPIIRRLNPSPLISLHMHCDWLTGMDKSVVLRRLTKADMVFMCSDYVTDRTRRHFPELGERLKVISNGVDTDSFRPAPASSPGNTKRVLFVGRLSPEKGVHTLVEAFAMVRNRLKDARLQLLGPQYQMSVAALRGLGACGQMAQLEAFCSADSRQAYYHHLASRVKAIGLDGGVEFHGPVPYEQLAGFYRQADVLVNASFIEAFGMTLVEAMACGVPVVATRVGGMTGILENGKTGLFFEPGDAPSLAGAITTLLENDTLRKTMGQNGRQEAIKRFSWQHIADELLARYDDAERVRN